MAMIAWHGSRYGECFFMRGHEKDVAWFSFYRDVAEEFAKLAWTEDERLPTLCKVQINGDRGQLFDAYDLYDDEFRERFTACLKAKGVDDQWLDSIIGSMQHYDFIAFDPDGGGTDSDKVAACVKELGYIGWLEREHHADDPENFGLFDPGLRVTVIEELKLCPDCMRDMEEVSEHEYECDSCESTYRICGDCGQAMDRDDEDEDWIHACDCGVRQNPSDSCKDTYRDLKDALSPDLHSARYNLSVAVGEAVDDCAKDRPEIAELALVDPLAQVFALPLKQRHYLSQSPVAGPAILAERLSRTWAAPISHHGIQAGIVALADAAGQHLTNDSLGARVSNLDCHHHSLLWSLWS